MTPQGPRTIAVDLSQHQAVAVWRCGGGRRCLARAVCLRPLGRVADGVARRALRRQRSRFSAATSPSTSSSCRSCKFIQKLLFMTRCWLAGVAVAAMHAAGQGLAFDPVRGVMVSATARRHLSWLAAALLLLMAFNAWLGIPNLLTTSGRDRPSALRTSTSTHACRCSGSWWWSACVGCAPRALSGQGASASGRSSRRSACTPAWRSPAALYAACCSASSWRRTSRCARRRTSSHSIAATRAGFALDRVVERQLSGEAQLTRAGHRAQCRHARQRAAVERAAAARHLRPDPGDPHLLRFRLRRQRPLRDRRRLPPDHAVGARAELRQPAQPHLDQRAPDLHAWLRPDARSRQRGHARRLAGALHQGLAAGLDGGPARSPSRGSTSASCRTTTSS